MDFGEIIKQLTSLVEGELFGYDQNTIQLFIAKFRNQFLKF
jgi:hypothetical protein